MHIPSSTYRIQFHKDFNFSDFSLLIPYLHDLGIQTIYAAPITKSTKGSMHGYDVVDPHVIDPEIGTLEELKEISKELKSRNMFWLQDIVPNHMAYSFENKRLMDVMERGRESEYYNYFDIDWNHHVPHLQGKLMVPFLGKELEQCLEKNDIQLSFTRHGFLLKYYDSFYPVSSLTYPFLIEHLKGRRESPLVLEKLNEYGSQITSGSSLMDFLAFKNEWNKSCFSNPVIREGFERIVKEINATTEEIHKLLDYQFYIFTYWKHTEFEINYRRFFTVNSLICLRMERDEVFEEYHRFIHEMVSSGLIQGVRIDHIDGLNDPSGYLKKLRKLLGQDCYIIAEKILELKEDIPEKWPLEGTSGYEFLSYVNQLFTDRHGSEVLVDYYYKLISDIPTYDNIVLENKKLILERHMAGEFDNLVEYFFALQLQGVFQKEQIRKALASLMLSLPVYRIYPDKLPLSGTDRELMEEAFSRALSIDPDSEIILQYLESLCNEAKPPDIPERNSILFLRRLMQFTGPLTAKGVEDTTFYIYNPLISHVEVGDAPSTLGIPLREFHGKMIRRQRMNPLSLNATATHDTKRGEDARIRLNVISTDPERWIQMVEEWFAINKPHRSVVDGKEAPSKNDEYFIYQSVIGGFPEDLKSNEDWVGRLKEYMVKVVREAKAISNWESPHSEYETACSDFIESILATDSVFLKSCTPYMKEIISISLPYSIGQVVVKITAPGIPDIYQGCELWDLSYVDPDNRRPVDYGLRQKFLQEILQFKDHSWEKLHAYLLENQESGILKQFAMLKLLQLRNRFSGVFEKGVYLPLTLMGSGTLALGYARYFENNWCIVVIPFVPGIKNKESSSESGDIFISLPANSPEEWQNIFTGERLIISDNRILLKELLSKFPVAVLCSGDGS